MVRDVQIIDAELRLLVAVRVACRATGGKPSSGLIDELLDERSGVTQTTDGVPTDCSSAGSEKTTDLGASGVGGWHGFVDLRC